MTPADEALQIVTAIEPLGAALNHALASTPLPEGVRVALNELTVTCSPAALRLIAANNGDATVTTRTDPDTGAPSRLTSLVTIDGLDLFMSAPLGGKR